MCLLQPLPQGLTLLLPLVSEVPCRSEKTPKLFHPAHHLPIILLYQGQLQAQTESTFYAFSDPHYCLISPDQASSSLALSH